MFVNARTLVQRAAGSLKSLQPSQVFFIFCRRRRQPNLLLRPIVYDGILDLLVLLFHFQRMWGFQAFSVRVLAGGCILTFALWQRFCLGFFERFLLLTSNTEILLLGTRHQGKSVLLRHAPTRTNIVMENPTFLSAVFSVTKRFTLRFLLLPHTRVPPQSRKPSSPKRCC